jgi:manganese/iron transport system substrate-binding protein
MIIILVSILKIRTMSGNFLHKKQPWQTLALSVVAGLASYSNLGLSAVMAQPSKPKVVATTATLCDVTKQIAQDTIDLTCLIDGGSDPHTYQPKPSDRLAIEQANLVLYAGYNFEPAILKIIKATLTNSPKIPVNEFAVPQPLQFEEDGQTENDPHVFHSAKNGARIVEIVGASLKRLQPSQTMLYTANTSRLSNEFLQIDRWIKVQIATIPVAQRKLVTTHDAFGYYSKAYDIAVVGALQGISTEEQATPKRVAELVGLIKQAGVPTIFAEVTINPKLINAVAKEANVKVSERELFADGIGEPGSEGETYQKMLIANTQTIVQGLGGRYTSFASSTSLGQPKTNLISKPVGSSQH